MLAIGLDIGTTTICAVVADSRTGELVESVTEQNNTFLQGAHSYERIQDAAAIAAQAQALTAALCEKYDGVGCIGVTGQMHGIVYLDREGTAVSPLYTWQDGRGGLPCRDGQTYAEVLSAAAGYGMATHFYNVQNGLIPRNAAVFCTIGDYVAMRLCGRKAPLLHPSNAASLGCFDLQDMQFACTEMDNALFPKVDAAASMLGATPGGVPVSAAVGDNQASFWGAVRQPETSILVNIGTGSQISMQTRQAEAADGVEIRPLCGGYCLAVGAALCGGRAYALLKELFAQCAAQTGGNGEGLYGLLSHQASAAMESGIAPPQVSPAFCGTRRDPEKRASITGLSPENFTMGHLALGVLQGIADELFSMIDPRKTAAAVLVGSGNGIRKNKLMQRILSQRYGLPLYIPRYEEEAAFGAALFALTGAGCFDTLAHAQGIIQYQPLRSGGSRNGI